VAKLKFGIENIRNANDANNAESTMPIAPTLKAMVNKILRCLFCAANIMIQYSCYKKKYYYYNQIIFMGCSLTLNVYFNVFVIPSLL
jgi:hypothetical protein